MAENEDVDDFSAKQQALLRVLGWGAGAISNNTLSDVLEVRREEGDELEAAGRVVSLGCSQ